MFVINMFHINIRNFHNNNRANKIALTILSQLKIWKGKQQNHFKKCKNTKNKNKKRSFFIVHFVYLNGLSIVALTLKVSDKIIDVFSKW